MRFACLVRTCLLIVGACPILGCGPETDDRAVPWSAPAPAAPQTSIAFDQPAMLALGLREERMLNVVVDPPEVHEVNFVLLGGSLDATLDRATVVTNQEGRASVKLRAPNKATTFIVRTWIPDGPSDEMNVSTSGEGFSKLEILPIYKGARVITEWTASIVARATCADIAPLLPNELPGALGSKALPDELLVVPDAPVGPSLAVTVRAGEFAWGCSDASGLIAGETTSIKVNVIDKPIDIGATNLDVTFSFNADPQAFYSLVNAASTTLGDALLPNDDNAATALLDAIAVRVPEPMAASFADARAAGMWDALVLDHLALQPASLRTVVETWLALGLVDEPSQFVGRLTALPVVPGSATLTPLRFGSMAAHDAGMPAAHLVKLNVDTGDVLHLGGSIYWLPTRYLGNVIAANALQGAPEGTTMPDALSSIIGCDALGQTLVGFDTCDATCLSGLCHETIAAKWENALDGSALAGNIGVINVAAAVTASVDYTAIPVSFQGSWLGNVSDGNIVAKINKSELVAKLPDPPPPP